MDNGEEERDKNFSIIFDGSLAHTVFYPANSTGGNKVSSAIYVPFRVPTPRRSSSWRHIQRPTDKTKAVKDIHV